MGGNALRAQVREQTVPITQRNRCFNRRQSQKQQHYCLRGRVMKPTASSFALVWQPHPLAEPRRPLRSVSAKGGKSHELLPK
jgi:hypothetical protein